MEVHSRNKVDAMHKNNSEGQLLKEKSRKISSWCHKLINGIVSYSRPCSSVVNVLSSHTNKCLSLVAFSC